MTIASDYFSDTAQTARARFLASCDRLGGRVRSFKSTVNDPEGYPLWADATRLGSVEARSAVVLCSASGGAAGFCAAGILTSALRLGLTRDLPRDTALVLVHAVNPMGPVWPLRAPDPYEDARPAPPPRGHGDTPAGIGEASEDGGGGNAAAGWSDSLLSGADRRYAEFIGSEQFDRERLAERTLADTAPPAWGGEVIEAIADDMLAGIERVCFIDFRTGPGQWGAFDIFPCAAKDSPAMARAAEWFELTGTFGAGKRGLTGMLEGDDAAPPGISDGIGPGNATAAGDMPRILEARTPEIEITTVLVEIGTYSMQTLLTGMSSHRSGKSRPAAYPSSDEWRIEAWKTARRICRNSFKGITGE